MKKIKLFRFLIIILGLFFAQSQELLGAFTFQTVCQPPLTKFSNGSSSFDISFPPATTCDTFPPADSNCPTVMLPANGTVFSMKVDIELADSASEIGTPYIWVPLSANSGLAQIKTSDGSFVSKFNNSNNWDCTGSCNTNSPTWTARGSTSCSFSNPSRITVIPGGDVWVANRSGSSVTRLGLVNPVTSTEIYECKGNYPASSGARGVTYDVDGNIWVGGTGDTRLYKFNPDGTYAWVSPYYKDIGYTTYGMIADSKGNVWISTGGLNVVRINNKNCDLSSCPVTVVSGGTFSISGSMTYGIGIDNEEDIWIGNWVGNSVDEIDNSTAQGKQDCVATFSECCTGTAVDKTNNVWTSGHSSNNVYVIKEGNCGSVYTKSSPCTVGNKYPHGIAIDFDNHAWVICRQGEVVKYEFDGSSINELKRINLNSGAGSGTDDSASYNYSDMTGLRTIPKTLSVGGISGILPSSSGTFEICADPSAPPLCSDPTQCVLITAYLATCTPDAMNNCEVPLEIFSMQAGDYTLKNLEVIYGKKVPVTTGGLIPCGREWNDLSTPWNETQSCNMCHLVILASLIINFLMGLVVLISILALVVAGLIYVKTAGDSSLITAAKQNVNKILYGFVIVFVAWAIINLVMVLLGFNDPIGDGSWKIFTCDL